MHRIFLKEKKSLHWPSLSLAMLFVFLQDEKTISDFVLSEPKINSIKRERQSLTFPFYVQISCCK